MSHPTPEVSPALSSGSSLSPTTSDQDLAEWLDACRAAGHRVAYIHAGYLCKIADLDEVPSPLHPADPGPSAKASLKALVGKRLLMHLALPPESLQALGAAREVDPTWECAPLATKGEVDELLATRDGLLGRTSGRGIPIDDRTAQKVWADAGGRCMFKGCGKDLTEIPLWTKAARVGYLAHIVASDPDGPRGTQADSHRLANNPENIMLMCDAHHRLIDAFAPTEYRADTLNEMRRAHRDKVRLYLGALSYPTAQAATLHANLANIPTYFHDSEFVEAILATGRSMHPTVLHYVRRTCQRDDRDATGFWTNYLREHEGQIRQLITNFNSATGTPTESLSVFPLHHIPTMILAGRIIGEAQSIQVFQYDRHRRSWAWDPHAQPKPTGTFNSTSLPTEQAQDVFVTIELSAAIDEEAIPAELRERIADGRLPWVRITTPSPRADCIAHPDDLDQFTRVARTVIAYVQDVMRVRRVHLIAMSPASSVFRFGQMLQAGHHPEYVVYDRPGGEYPFIPAFSITSHAVSALDSERSFSIALR